jgi:hypothetical protein
MTMAQQMFTHAEFWSKELFYNLIKMSFGCKRVKSYHHVSVIVFDLFP